MCVLLLYFDTDYELFNPYDLEHPPMDTSTFTIFNYFKISVRIQRALYTGKMISTPL